MRSSVGCRNTWPPGWHSEARQRLSQAGEEIRGGSPAVLRRLQLPGGDVRPTSARWDGHWWTSLPAGPVCGGGCARGAAELGRRRSWPWSCWSEPWGWATSRPDGLPGTTGMSPSFRRGDALRLDVPGSTPVPLELAWTSPGSQGSGRPRKQARAASYHGAAQWRVAG